jgi:hypothetical protein
LRRQDGEAEHGGEGDGESFEVHHMCRL